MLNNNKLVSSKLTGAATTTNLKLQSLDSVYTRLLNKNIDLTQIKKVNSAKKIKNFINVNILIDFFDYLLFIIVTLTLLSHFILLFSFIIHNLFEIFNINGSRPAVDLICSMVETSSTASAANTSTSTSTTTTTVQIIPDEGSWSNGVKTLFIYGTGALRFYKSGTPASRFAVAVSTIAMDAASKVLFNTINDPDYVRNHMDSWSYVYRKGSEGIVDLRVDPETLKKITSVIPKSDKFLGDGNNLGDLGQSYLNSIFEHLKFILEPVQVNYSNEVLANQIYDISIILFIMSILLTGMIIILLFNIFLYINMDRIIKIFKNKYIIWYLSFNKKIMGIEIFLLGSTIIYFMYTLSVGIRFIATHPIILNQ